MSTPFSSLAADISMYVPNCVSTTVEYAIRQATIEFCRDTLWWVEELDPETVQAGQVEVDIPVPSQTQVVSLEQVKLDDVFLRPRGRDDRMYGSGVEGYEWAEPSMLRFHPGAPRDGEIRVRAALAPTVTATAADEAVMSTWREAIVDAALTRLYLIPNQPFSNPEAAVYRDSRYKRSVVRARMDTNKARTRSRLRVRARPMA